MTAGAQAGVGEGATRKEGTSNELEGNQYMRNIFTFIEFEHYLSLQYLLPH